MARRKNDDGRGAVYAANDGTYHASAKARDAHENRGALEAWLTAAGSEVDALVDAILADGATFLALLRKAGVRSKRGSKVAEQQKAA